MVDRDGNVLIDETILNPCTNLTGNHVKRPSIVVDWYNNLHIVFHGFSLYTKISPKGYQNATYLQSSEVIYIKIDPYLDDRDGDPADFYKITKIPETIISTIDKIKSRAPNMDIYKNRLHIAWWEGDNWGGNAKIHYKVLDLSGNTIVTEKSFLNGVYVDIDWGEPEIATDPDGNAHIVYCREWDNIVDGSNKREVFYMMVNGLNGNILINDTQITHTDGNASVKPYLDVDSKGLVHVVWHDKRTGPDHELFYSVLDPNLDDQNGNSANPNVISVVKEQMITVPEGANHFITNIAIDRGDRVHIPWKVERRSGLGTPAEIQYQMRDATGNTIIYMNLTDFNDEVDPAIWYTSSERSPDIDVTCDRVYVTFNGMNTTATEIPGDGTYNTFDIYLVILKVPPCEFRITVGGEIMSADILQLLAPYIMMAIFASMTVVGIVYKKRI